MKTAIASLVLFLAAAADAAVVASAVDGKARIDLHDEAGHCLASARLAIYYHGQERIPGCWTLNATGNVAVAFLDGDFVQVPAGAFKKPDDV